MDLKITLISEKKTSKSEINYENKLFIGTLRGDIQLPDYQDMSINFGEALRRGDVENIIVDRRDAQKIATENRVWWKNVFLKEYSDVSKVLKKIALIKSGSSIGNFYVNSLYSAVSLLYPNITIKNFNSFEDAFNWVELKDSEKLVSTETTSQISEENTGKSMSINELIGEDIDSMKENSSVSENKKKTLLNKILDLFFSK